MHTISFCNRNLVVSMVLATLGLAALHSGSTLASELNRGDQSFVVASPVGYLFVNGVYIEPPYNVETLEKSISINGERYEAADFGVADARPLNSIDGQSTESTWSRRRGERSFGRGPREESRGNSPLRSVFHDLSSAGVGATVVVEKGRSPMVLWPEQGGDEFLELAQRPQAERIGAIELPASIVGSGHESSYRDFLGSFVATPNFLKRLSDEHLQRTQLTSRVDFDLAVKKWVDLMVYPLTLLALMLVVFAVGHLMANAQSVFDQDDSIRVAVETNVMRRNIVRSLLLVVGFSIIDLVWTVMAHQNGSMRELNPIGSRLIANPLMLVAFKTAVTGTSIGLLYWLRAQPLARKATWWCCLVLTLLTARWLTFHSLLA